jgi:hypothetical protein
MSPRYKSAYFSTEGDTTISLQSPLELENYACGLTKISGKIDTSNGMYKKKIYLCCDMIEESLVEKTTMPVLHKIETNNYGKIDDTINHVIWLSIIRPTITSIRLYICDEHQKVVSLSKSLVNCTLLFIPPKQK